MEMETFETNSNEFPYVSGYRDIPGSRYFYFTEYNVFVSERTVHR